MESRNIYKNISPLDCRYYLSNKEIFDDLSRYFSEEAGIVYCVKAETALLKCHIDNYFNGREEYLKAADDLVTLISPEEVYQEEEKTQHNIRALVNVIKKRLPNELSPYVHLGATSVDILDTAAAMKTGDGVKYALLPLLTELEDLLANLAEQNADIPQVGRTHGQHAVPITMGYTFAEYVSRLGKSIIEINKLSGNLRGKLSGAVGAYNATSLLTENPFELERKYLSYLGLEPSEFSTQMVEPEYLLRLLVELNIAFGILANLADDLRHLQRSEISELREFFSSTQVGSSTMPQKRNPWNSEHVKSLWKTFSPRIATFFMDQISEHQRDLSNSASARFVGEFIAGLAAAANRMKKILSSLYIDNEQCMKNLSFTGDLVLAEAAYVLLAGSGEKDAHEVIRKITLSCNKNNTLLLEEIKKNPKVYSSIRERLSKTAGYSMEEFFSNPSLYRGKSAEIARNLAKKYREKMKTIRESIR